MGDYVKTILVDPGPFQEKEKFLKLFSRYLENTFKNVKKIEAVRSNLKPFIF